MGLLVRALQEDKTAGLDLSLFAGQNGLSQVLTQAKAQRTGLALAGFLKAVDATAVQVFGRNEMSFLDFLGGEPARQALNNFLALNVPCVVIAQSQKPPDYLVDLVEEKQIALFGTSLSAEAFVTLAERYLEEHLNPELSYHAVLMEVFGLGVLLTGSSGVGKSECALDLVLRGHRLVADDVVMLSQQGRHVVGTGSSLTRHHMEVRGLGIINVRDLFGAASVRKKKRVDLVVELIEWSPGMECDRSGLEELCEPLLEVCVPKVRLPIRPGRNVASIVEVAARNHMLKQQGHNAALELKTKLEKQLSTQGRC